MKPHGCHSSGRPSLPHDNYRWTTLPRLVYAATGVVFEPVTIRTQETEPTTESEPPRPLPLTEMPVDWPTAYRSFRVWWLQATWGALNSMKMICKICCSIFIKGRTPSFSQYILTALPVKTPPLEVNSVKLWGFQVALKRIPDTGRNYWDIVNKIISN